MMNSVLTFESWILIIVPMAGICVYSASRRHPICFIAKIIVHMIYSIDGQKVPDYSFTSYVRFSRSFGHDACKGPFYTIISYSNLDM